MVYIQNILIIKLLIFELQLIFKRILIQNNKNGKYVIRYLKEDNEEVEIIEINYQNIEYDGDEIVKFNDGIEIVIFF